MIPQGSVFGPKLFILYLNDICKLSNIFKLVIFADDTNLYCSGPDIAQLISQVESELTKFKKWFDLNKLSLNEKKTKFMIFGSNKDTLDVKLMWNGIEIDQVYETRFLGVIVDHQICWKPHIQYIRTKISKTLGILYKTKYILNKKCLHILYTSLVFPYFFYCCEIWGNTCKTCIDPLIKLQKK